MLLSSPARKPHMTKLSSLLSSKIESKKLTLTAAANSAKVTFPSLRAVLDGRSAPNSRSVPKYAKFLGISEEQVIAASGPRGGKKRGRGKEKAAKTKGKRGRPKLPGVAKGTIKLLKEGLASIQKRMNRMNGVIDKIARTGPR